MSEVHPSQKKYLAVKPFQRDEKHPHIIRDAADRIVIICDGCGILYSDLIEDDGWFICQCGRLGQRMSEATAEECGLPDVDTLTTIG